MTYYVKQTELFHAGVKGMKWGHRKARPTSGGAHRGVGKKPASKAEIARKEARKQKAKKYVKKGAKIAGITLAAIATVKVVKTAAVVGIGMGASRKFMNSGF